MDGPDLETARRVLDANRGEIMAWPGVHGCGLGLTADERGPAIVVYLDRADAAASVPGSLGGVPVRGVVTGIPRAL